MASRLEEIAIRHFGEDFEEVAPALRELLEACCKEVDVVKRDCIRQQERAKGADDNYKLVIHQFQEDAIQAALARLRKLGEE